MQRLAKVGLWWSCADWATWPGALLGFAELLDIKAVSSVIGITWRLDFGVSLEDVTVGSLIMKKLLL